MVESALGRNLGHGSREEPVLTEEPKHEVSADVGLGVDGQLVFPDELRLLFLPLEGHLIGQRHIAFFE